MNDAETDLLLRSASASAPALLATLTHPPSQWRLKLVKSSVEGVWVQAVDGKSPELDALVASSSPVGVFFLSHDGPAAFTSVIIGQNSNADTQDPMLLLRAPERLHTFDRRKEQRVLVPDSLKLHIRLFRRPPRGEKREILGKAWDRGGCDPTLPGCCGSACVSTPPTRRRSPPFARSLRNWPN